MLTDSKIAKATSIFFFAHQDDEYGVFDAILFERSKGNEIICIYLTSGALLGGDSSRRNEESLRVLRKLGVSSVLFIGEKLQIADLQLINHLEVAANWVENFLSSFSKSNTIFVLAWEGGHPDHDALHALVVHIANRQGKINCLRQFALYNSFRCPWQFFKTLSPLAINGPVIANKIAFINRLKFLGYLVLYRSQLKTWIGLFPFVLWHYLIYGVQELQEVSLSRINERPHVGALYYEKRKFSNWTTVNKRIVDWIANQE